MSGNLKGLPGNIHLSISVVQATTVSRKWYGRCLLKLKPYSMTLLLYIITIVLVIGWSLGYFVYAAGSIIHTLLIMAVITILLSIIRGKRPV
jgi:hypothetical protein